MTHQPETVDEGTEKFGGSDHILTKFFQNMFIFISKKISTKCRLNANKDLLQFS